MRRKRHACKSILWLAVCFAIDCPLSKAAVNFQFAYFDPAGVGFNDPTLGAARRASLESTAAQIGGLIGQTATVEIRVNPSQFDGTGFIGIAVSNYPTGGPPAAGIFDGEVYRRIVLG